MPCKGFVVAMRAHVATVPFDRPFLRDDAADPDWLIVSRWGGNAEYLTISTAGDRLAGSLEAAARAGGAEGCPDGTAHDASAEPAPLGLHPRRTWFGVLTPDDRGGESVFLLNRALPKDMPVAGRFAPAEGFVRLTMAEDGPVHLVAVAREMAEPVAAASVAGASAGGASVVPLKPASWPRPVGAVETAVPAQAWMLTAERRPWAGEFLDCPPEVERPRRRA